MYSRKPTHSEIYLLCYTRRIIGSASQPSHHDMFEKVNLNISCNQGRNLISRKQNVSLDQGILFSILFSIS